MSSDKTYRVLFLGRENAARSLMAEGLLRELGGGRFQAESAGIDGIDQADDLAVHTMELAKISTDGLRPKSVADLPAGDGHFDFVITVSDRVGDQDLPSFAGSPMVVKWGTDDPRAIEGPQSERQVAYSRAFRQLRNRIEVFANLPIERLDRLMLQAKMDTLGEVRPRD